MLLSSPWLLLRSLPTTSTSQLYPDVNFLVDVDVAWCGQLSESYSAGACCPWALSKAVHSLLSLNDVLCVVSCLRRAQQRKHAWILPQLSIPQLITCADSVNPDGLLDQHEIFLLAECLVPDDSFVQSLVTCASHV